VLLDIEESAMITTDPCHVQAALCLSDSSLSLRASPDVIAGENDVEAFRMVGLAVAMGNAVAEVCLGGSVSANNSYNMQFKIMSIRVYTQRT